MLYEHELSHNPVKAIKNICCAKGEGAFDFSIVTRWSKKSHSSSNNFDNLAKSDRLESADFVLAPQAIDVRG